MDAGYELIGRGSDLAIDVRGPDAVSCLVSAVEAFGAAVAETGTDVRRRGEAIELRGEDPADLLLDLMDEAVLRLDSDGDVAVGARDARLEGGTLRVTLELVRLDDVEASGTSPKAATWHGLRLEQTTDGWEGHVMLDL